jgi:hypothetical protein
MICRISRKNVLCELIDKFRKKKINQLNFGYNPDDDADG